jgi:hypothetical protein
MRRTFFLIISVCILSQISNAQPPLKKEIDSGITRILIINSFDAQSMKARKNKKEFFTELTDTLKQMLSLKFIERNKLEVIVIPVLISNPENNDSLYFKLVTEHKATYTIVIRNLNAWFEQTDVEVVKESDGKKRTASFYICSAVTYCLYKNSSKQEESEIKKSEFFTKRNVVSGLLAAGPDVVGKSKYVIEMIEKNAAEYVRSISRLL